MTPRAWAGLVVITVLALVASYGWAPPAPSLDSVSPAELVQTTQLVWTATRSLTQTENATAHFRRHGRDVGAVDVQDYIDKTRRFLHHPPAGTQIARQRDGDVVRFYAPTGAFAVMRADGVPRTHFILRPEIHGYPTNQAYFDAQKRDNRQ